jgi:hypothetical protein
MLLSCVYVGSSWIMKLVTEVKHIILCFLGTFHCTKKGGKKSQET